MKHKTCINFIYDERLRDNLDYFNGLRNLFFIFL